MVAVVYKFDASLPLFLSVSPNDNILSKFIAAGRIRYFYSSSPSSSTTDIPIELWTTKKEAIEPSRLASSKIIAPASTCVSAAEPKSLIVSPFILIFLNSSKLRIWILN